MTRSKVSIENVFDWPSWGDFEKRSFLTLSRNKERASPQATTAPIVQADVKTNDPIIVP